MHLSFVSPARLDQEASPLLARTTSHNRSHVYTKEIDGSIQLQRYSPSFTRRFAALEGEQLVSQVHGATFSLIFSKRVRPFWKR